jgi:uncharacterized membrane protein
MRVLPWLPALLVVSLALNFIVLGSIAGAMWRSHGSHHHRHGVTPNLLGFASTLSADRRKVLWENTAEQRRQVRPFRREVRVAREETLRALTAEPFDRQAFLTAQERQAEAENRARGAVHALYAELASRLTAEERKEFRRWREKRRPPGQNLLDEPDLQAKDPN